MGIGKAVAAAVMTFDVPVGAGNEGHDRCQRQEFDQAGRPDDRLKEGCQHCGVAYCARGWLSSDRDQLRWADARVVPARLAQGLT